MVTKRETHARIKKELRQEGVRPVGEKRISLKKFSVKKGVKGVKGKFKSQKKFKTAQLRKNLLKSGMYPKLPKKRSLSPARQMQLKRLQQLKKQQTMLNTNPQAVMENYHQSKRQAMIQQALKSKQLSPSVRYQLEQIQRIQTKGHRDNAEQQRRNREKELIFRSTSILATPNIFRETYIDPTGISSDNILRSPNVFKELPDNNILKPRRRTILDTEGNDLMF